MSSVIEAKSSTELRIRPWEHAALIRLAPQLQAGSRTIDMRTLGYCLGSRVAQAGGRIPATYMGLVYSHALSPLYFPGHTDRGEIDLGHPGWLADNAKAARAIVNFLELGHPCWLAAMSGQKPVLAIEKGTQYRRG